MLLFIGIGGQEMLLVFLSFFILPIIPLWTICKKSGQHPLLSLLALFPVIGLVLVLYIIAFSRWQIRSQEPNTL